MSTGLEDNKLYFCGYEVVDRVLADQRPKCVFDLGANLGGWIVKWFQNGAEWCHAFEPVPNLAPNLRAMAEADPRIIFNQVAVGDVPGRIEGVNVHNQWTLLQVGSGRVPLARDYKNQSPFGMEVITLDDYIAQTGVRPDFLKVDVDGYELRVLRGARKFLSEFPVPMYFEYSFLPQLLGDSVGEMCHLIYELGYRAVCMDGSYFSPDWQDMRRYFPKRTSFDIMLLHESSVPKFVKS
jgi:FkbM family methyltransferase